MKNSIIALALILTAYTVKAQRNVDRTNFRAGINAGLVVGDFSEEYSFALGVDFYHHWGVTKALDVGITAGFFNAFGEGEKVLTDGITETEFDNLQYLPLGASLRIYPGKNVGFKFGSDIGYAVGVSDGLEGALYYKPSLGIDLRNGSAEFNISYLLIDDDISYSSVLVGYLFLF